MLKLVVLGIVGVIAFLFLGWLTAIVVPVLLFFNVAHLRSKLSALPAFRWADSRRGLFAFSSFLVIGFVWLLPYRALIGSGSKTPTPTKVSTSIPSTTATLSTLTQAPTTIASSPTLVPPTATEYVAPSATALPPTPTHIPATATTRPPTATPAPPTPTPVPPTVTPGPSKAQAQVIDPRKLAADPASYVDRNIVLTGEVRNVESRSNPATIFKVLRLSYTWTDFLAFVPGRSDLSPESVAAYFFPKNPKILRGNPYKIWGIVRGTEDVTIVLTGATRTVPDIEVYSFTEISQP